MSKTKYPYAVVFPQAERLRDLLRPACEQIAIAGSLRRNKSGDTAYRIGDIEIVCIPQTSEQTIPGQLSLFDDQATASRVQRISALDPVLDALIEGGTLHRDHPYGGEKGMGGERYKKLFTRWTVEANGERLTYVVQVDLFIVLPPSQWGAQLLIRTGPADFNQALMGYINRFTPFQQDGGQLVDNHTGKPVDTPDEKSYFRALGLPYIAPHRRTKEVVAAWSRGKKKVTKAEPTPEGPAIKALTIWQPWASLIADGSKQYETRSWPTAHKGLLAIHAAKKKPTVDYSDLGIQDDEQVDELPLGAIIAIARVVDCLPTAQLVQMPGFTASTEYTLGNFAPGRFGWKLEIIKVFDEPIPATGAQGLWEWHVPLDVFDPNAVAAVLDGQPVTHAQAQQLADGSRKPGQGETLPLTTQIAAILRATPRSHRIGVRQRLNCTNADFALALDTLKALGEISEDSDHFLSLVPRLPKPDRVCAGPESLATAYHVFTGRVGVSDQLVRDRIRARLLARAGLEHAA